MIFGKTCADTCLPLMIGDCSIEFVNEWKYLGTTLINGKHFAFSAKSDIASFFRASNAIIHSLPGADESVILRLLQSNCIPIITYACAVKQFSASEMSDCNLAINNALRRVFGFKDWRSIRALREVFNLKSIYVEFKTAQDRFIESCRHHCNPIIRFLVTLMP